MANHTVTELSLDQILLDLENPRNDITESQRTAIGAMIDEQADKLVNLAKHISENGISPSKLPIVTPHPTEKNKFIALDGNRRITAIKILAEPELANLSKNSAVAKQLKAIKFDIKKLRKISCAVYESRTEALPWVKLEHTGENLGVGMVRWDAQSVARFNERFDSSSPALQVLEFVKSHAGLDAKTVANLKNVKITNLDRLMADPKVRDFVGIEIEKGVVSAKLEKSEITKGLKKIVSDLANNKINVNTIRKKEDRENYLEKFSTSDIPSRKKVASSPWLLEDGSPSSVSSKATLGGSSKSSIRSKPLSINRKTLIPSSCILKIDAPRINSIYRELKRLELSQYVNACAVLFRVFFEVSLDHYIKQKKLTGVTDDSKLTQKVDHVANDLEQKGVLKKNELKAPRGSITNKHSVLSVDTMHAYVHNKNYSPIEKDLKVSWDNIQQFMEALWN